MEEEKLSLALNNALRTTPLAVSWLNTCEIPTTDGRYSPKDVCSCFVATCSSLNDRFITLDLGRGNPVKRSADPFAERLSKLTEEKASEIDAALLCAETAAELDSDGGALQDLMRRFDMLTDARSDACRVLTALAAVICLICTHMAILFGPDWMDRFPVHEEQIQPL